MKQAIFLACMIPLICFSQKLKVNEYDKFIKQRRVEMESMSVLSTSKANISLSFTAIGNSLFASLNGFGWGGNTVTEGNELIFLFANDSTITVKSTGLQTYEITGTGNNYKHSYFISVPQLEMLSRYELVGVRKYGFKDFSDLPVSKTCSDKINKLSLLFIGELKKANIIQTLKKIDIKDIAQHVGDSVQFFSKVFAARYFVSSEKRPTVLDVNDDYTKGPISIVIWDEERKNFATDPENLYKNKDVCISGVVKLFNNVPQIVLHSKEQIKVNSPIELNEAIFFIGDTMTVKGKVFTAKYLSTSASAPTLLNLGAAYPDQLFTAVIENRDRKNFEVEPENYYSNKEISVRGKIVLYNNKPQIIISSKDQIKVIGEDNAKFAKTENTVTHPSMEGVTAKAEFPGGADAWLVFLKKNLKCPSGLVFGEAQIVVARFLVSPKGDISNIEIVQSAGKTFDNEVLKVLKRMPLWRPQIIKGNPIGSVVTQKFSFRAIENGEEEIKTF